MARIVVVEDEPIVADDLAAALGRLGHDVPTIAATGQDAIRAVERDAPDLVFMDIRLRGPMDGIDAAARIRARADVPVVFLTADADPETVRRACGASPYGYLLKPFREGEVGGAVHIALRAHAERRQAERGRAELLDLVAGMRDAVVVVDAALTVQVVNRAAERATGMAAADAAGAPLLTVAPLVDPASRRALSAGELAAVVRAGPGAPPRDLLLVERGGAELPVEVSAIALDRRGERTAVLLRDAAELRRLRDAAARMPGDPAAKGLARELQAPLAVTLLNQSYALGGLGALRDALPPGLPDEARERLEDVEAALGDARRGAERMRDVVRTVFDAEPLTDAAGLVDLRGVTAAIVRTCQERVRTGAQLRFVYRPAPRVAGDAPALARVGTALVMAAAARFRRPEQGRNGIVLSVRTAADGSAELAVEDDAMAAAPGGDPWEGLDLDEAQACRAIVERHLGRVRVHPAEAGGRKVVLLLPPARRG